MAPNSKADPYDRRPTPKDDFVRAIMNRREEFSTERRAKKAATLALFKQNFREAPALIGLKRASRIEEQDPYQFLLGFYNSKIQLIQVGPHDFMQWNLKAKVLQVYIQFFEYFKWFRRIKTNLSPNLSKEWLQIHFPKAIRCSWSQGKVFGNLLLIA